MASSRCLHPILENAVKARSSILIYGPASTGKTHIAFAIQRCSPPGVRAIVVATEPGTLAFSRHYGIPAVEVLSIDEMARVVTRLIMEGIYPIIDTINWHYRSSPGHRLGRIVAYVSSLLGASGGVAVAQVSGDGEASGASYIVPWMEYQAYTEKLGNGRYKMTIQKPYKRIIIYRLAGREVEWL
ncbi:MAG: ATP-binding protein [Desulfurococcales archaeon]|nr:ATP-binding protein [Desulfurococcales archaeon]MCE4605614.1 ATP-binding protein [Desulfurococcales archaeon]